MASKRAQLRGIGWVWAKIFNSLLRKVTFSCSRLALESANDASAKHTHTLLLMSDASLTPEADVMQISAIWTVTRSKLSYARGIYGGSPRPPLRYSWSGRT